MRDREINRERERESERDSDREKKLEGETCREKYEKDAG